MSYASLLRTLTMTQLTSLRLAIKISRSKTDVTTALAEIQRCHVLSSQRNSALCVICGQACRSALITCKPRCSRISKLHAFKWHMKNIKTKRVSEIRILELWQDMHTLTYRRLSKRRSSHTYSFRQCLQQSTVM